MPSKMVTDRQKTALSLVSAMQTFKAQLQAAINALTERFNQGEGFDLNPLFDLLVLAVQDAVGTLAVADAESERERAEDAQDRAARDAANEALIGLLVELGEALSAIYGPTARRAVALQGDTPRDPYVVLEASKRAADALPGLSLPPRVKGMTFDPTSYQEGLREGAQALDAALVSLSKNLRETDQAQVAKDAAMAHYHKTYMKVATLFEAFCRVADLDALADRVRRSVSRPEVPIQADDPATAPAADDAASKPSA